MAVIQKKILFAFYPLHIKYNHAIALLSALCREKEIETDIHLLNTEDMFLKYILSSQPDYIGFSCVTKHDYEMCLPFMEIARHLGIETIAGGVYVRRIGYAPVDHVCKGEGESLPDFILKENTELFMKDLYTENLNSLPLPDYELFKNIPFKRGMPVLEGKKVLPYYSSRGCPHKCSFCEISYQSGKVRIRTRVKEDLSYLSEKYHPDVFFIGDELLPYYSPEWRDSWGKFSHPFVAYIRADIQEDQLKFLHDRGMTGCAFGVESGDEVFRNEMLNKNLSDADIYNTVEMLHKYNIQYVHFYMSDLPGETWEMTAKTHRMATSLGGNYLIFKYENLEVI